MDKLLESTIDDQIGRVRAACEAGHVERAHICPLQNMQMRKSAKQRIYCREMIVQNITLALTASV